MLQQIVAQSGGRYHTSVLHSQAYLQPLIVPTNSIAQNQSSPNISGAQHSVINQLVQRMEEEPAYRTGSDSKP